MTAKSENIGAAAATTEGTRQILTFVLNEQHYGLDLSRVQEIRGYSPITPIPNMPPHIKGVLNLRGSVLPVVDMRLKFGHKAIPYNKFTVIVIAQSHGKSVGLIVDGISDVMAVSSGMIQAPPDFGETTDARFIEGLMKSGEQLAVLLDLDRVLAECDITAGSNGACD